MSCICWSAPQSELDQTPSELSEDVSVLRCGHIVFTVMDTNFRECNTAAWQHCLNNVCFQPPAWQLGFGDTCKCQTKHYNRHAAKCQNNCKHAVITVKMTETHKTSQTEFACYKWSTWWAHSVGTEITPDLYGSYITWQISCSSAAMEKVFHNLGH